MLLLRGFRASGVDVLIPFLTLSSSKYEERFMLPSFQSDSRDGRAMEIVTFLSRIQNKLLTGIILMVSLCIEIGLKIYMKSEDIL